MGLIDSLWKRLRVLSIEMMTNISFTLIVYSCYLSLKFLLLGCVARSILITCFEFLPVFESFCRFKPENGKN